MTRDEHAARHRQLYDALCELLDDYTAHFPYQQSTFQLLNWAAQQKDNPSDLVTHRNAVCAHCGAAINGPHQCEHPPIFKEPAK